MRHVSVPGFLLLALLAASCARAPRAATHPPHPAPVSERTTAAERAAFADKLRTQTIAPAFADPPGDANEQAWQGAFWASNLMLERTHTTRSAVATALDAMPRRSPAFQRAALESLHALYPGAFLPEVDALLDTVDGPRNFAMVAYHLLDAQDDPAVRTRIRRAMERRFPAWRDDSILVMLDARLERTPEERVADRPPLEDMLAAPFLPGRPVLFSLQRTDRRHPGLAVIRTADGRFLRDPAGAFFSVPHLALAVSNLPGTITNGNTPQGILSIRGDGTSDNVFIGPTPVLVSRLPHEVSVPDFFLDDGLAGGWEPALYDGLLPESWRAYLPIHEAWHAGRAGRSEIILHGTTINPAFYEGEPCHPMTPSLGCLTALELWSPEDGTLAESGQLALWQAWMALGDGGGTLVVVEVDAADRPVTLDDVADALAAAERR